MAFVEDSFTGNESHIINHVGEVGATWEYHPARSSTSGGLNVDGEVQYGGIGAQPAFASGLPATNEYDVEWDDIYDSGTPSFGPMGRMHPTDSNGYLTRYNGSQWDIFKWVSGTFTSIGSFVESRTAGSSVRCKLEIRNASKKLFVAGVERISSADDSVTVAGRVGLRGSAGGNQIDNLAATDASAGTTITVSETISITESPSLTAAITVSEALAIAEALTAAAALAIAEGLTITEALSVSNGSSLITVSESLTISEAISIANALQVVEAISLTEQVAISAMVAVLETLGFTEVVTVFDESQRIVSMTFSMKTRDTTFAAKTRTITFTLEQ